MCQDVVLDQAESFKDLIFGFLAIDLGKFKLFHRVVKSPVAGILRSPCENIQGMKELESKKGEYLSDFVTFLFQKFEGVQL